MPGGRRIYIIGFMGSGKTTAGKKLASTLRWSFFDLDTIIENNEKRFIKDIFTHSGEEYFRKIESETLKNPGLLPGNDYVISVGGGTPCFFDNMDYMLSDGLVVYLRMTPGQLRARLESEAGNRPLLKGYSEKDLMRFIKTKLSEREPFYSRASIITDGFSFNALQLAEKIRGHFKK